MARSKTSPHSLPKNHLDAIKRYRPYLLPAVKKDAEAARAAGLDYPINDDGIIPGSSLGECLRRAVEVHVREVASHLGIPYTVLYSGGPLNLDALPEHLANRLDNEIRVLVNQVMLEYFALLNFNLGGQKTFRFSDPLIAELAETSSNVRCEFLFLPYKSCVFISQSSLVVNALHAYVNQGGLPEDPAQMIPGRDYETPITIFLTEIEHAEGLPHITLSMLVQQSDHRAVGASIKRALYLDPTWTVERALRTDWDEIRGAPNPEASAQLLGIRFSADTAELSSVEDAEFSHTDARFLIRLIVNMALYVSSTDPDLLPGAGARMDKAVHDKLSRDEKIRLRREAHESSDLPFTEVGSRVTSITIGPEHDFASTGVTGTRGPVKVRFKVRAHWREQRVGPGRKDVKRIHIKEHLRGPEMAELVNRHYEVDLPQPGRRKPG